MSSTSIETLVAERELFNLLASFDDAAIRTDLEAFRNLWTNDAVWEIADPMPMRAEGPDAIVEALTKLQGQNLFFFRLTARPVILIDGDHASMRSPTVELAGRAGHKAYANVALYNDEAVRSPSGWRFRYRHYAYLWFDARLQLSGDTVPLIAGGTGAAKPQNS